MHRPCSPHLGALARANTEALEIQLARHEPLLYPGSFSVCVCVCVCVCAIMSSCRDMLGVQILWGFQSQNHSSYQVSFLDNLQGRLLRISLKAHLI